MDDTTPDISVIIASYNIEHYIQRAIDSALNQQGMTIEVIVVDDCSTDKTWSIICQNTDSRVRRIRLETNSGTSVARNTAIAQASGKWLAILDGDDIFLPNRLTRCLTLAKKKDAEIVVDNIIVYNDTNQRESLMFSEKIFANIKQLDLATFLAEKVANSNYTLGYLKPLFSLDFLREHLITYDTNLKIGEDYIFLAEALANGGVCVVEPTAGYQYTVRTNSISHRLSLTDIENIEAADAKFSAKYTLGADSRKAHKKRRTNFRKEYYNLMQVNALKHKDILKFLQITCSYPPAATLLLRPLQARIIKLLRFQPGKTIIGKCLIYLIVTSVFLVNIEAYAGTIPFFVNYPHIDNKTWYISNGWVNGDHQSCEWRKDAVSVANNKLKLTLSNNGGALRTIGCAEIHTQQLSGYGTYTARIKTANGSGLNTAFFTYIGPAVKGGDHSEIDFEFLGKDSRIVQLNYFDKGVSQGETIVRLNFDTSKNFHNYSFVWKPTEIRWYVDGRLIHQTKNNTKIPTNPGRIYLSLWSGSESINDWLGPFTYTKPVSAEFEWIKYEPL